MLKLLKNRFCSQCSVQNVLFTICRSKCSVHNMLFTCLLEAYWPCLECKIGCSWESRKKGEFILWKQNMCGNPFQGNFLQSWAEQQKGNILKNMEQLFTDVFFWRLYSLQVALLWLLKISRKTFVKVKIDNGLNVPFLILGFVKFCCRIAGLRKFHKRKLRATDNSKKLFSEWRWEFVVRSLR